MKFSAAGVSLDYVEHGEGEPLVLVHGSASDRRTWAAQLHAFAERYRVIAYSRRYHWPNAPIPDTADYAMAEHVSDLAALLRFLGGRPAHLVGHSYGAFVALLLAVREPGLVRSLVLAEPPVITLFVSNQPKPSELLRVALRRPRTAAALIRFGATGAGPATAAARRGDMDKAMRVFGQAVLGRAHHARLSPERREQVAANAIKAELLGSGFPPVKADEIRQIRPPALLLDGADSPALFHRLNDRLEELLPRARRAWVPAASHVVHEDNPQVFNATVLAFLSEAASAS